ncbi:DoxX family protein [Flammeovirga sp. SubArs3]|uniref:DoxX family protein n=1 Tax=Flammeovirga sp. SubArs3 TaxID=2995316 RepID=UPI00248C9F61|nr:DoxX family protein [Flammeovirga sp. SubArs3]
MNLILKTSTDKSIVIIRWMVGFVFLSEGIQKFLYPTTRGAGRFLKIGLPNPEFLGDFVGAVEILAGVLLILGIVSRIAALNTFIIMCVAIITTKIPQVSENGIWSALHASRTDWAMWCGSLFILLKGSGPFSFDYYFMKKK